MIVRLIKKFVADCGKKFSSKGACLNHEVVCVCWQNPKYKTCKTCKFSRTVKDSNGMEDEPGHLQTWTYIECTNPKFNYDIHFKAAHANAPDLCINCPVHETKPSILKRLNTQQV